MREDQEVNKEFGKDAGFEHVMSLMNDSLFTSQQKLIKDLPEIMPTIHIIGAPRSGTTLAVQILAESLNLGYINNLIAAFWKAPLFGINLSSRLLPSEYHSSYNSKFGRTDHIQEPHEFGYFWNYHLKYDDFRQRGKDHEKKIEWKNFAVLLKNMCRAFNKPVLFKSFLFGFHAGKAVAHLEKTCFIYIRRSIIDNALSLLKMRREYIGDVEEWASIKPLQYDYLKGQNRYVQVAGQVLFLELEYLKQIKALPEENRIIVDYEDLCENPVDFVTKTNDLVANHFEKLKQSDPETEHLSVKSYNMSEKEIKKIEEAIIFLVDKHPELKELMKNRKENE